MPLKELDHCIGELAARLSLHEKTLQRSEIQTRYNLVDPLLRALGWNVEDPTLVRLYDQQMCAGPERFCPYELIYDGEVCLALKTKALNSDLTELRAQRREFRDNVPYLAVTDGRRWEVYATHGLTVPDKDLVLKFDILNAPAESAEQASFLQPSVIGTCGPIVPVFPLTEAIDVARLTAAETTHIDELYLPTDTRGPLTKWTRVELESWKDLCVRVVEHLVKLGKLRPDDCPIRRDRGHRYLVHKQDYHSNGSPFDNPTPVGQIWVDTKWDRTHLVENTQIILRHVGEDPQRYGFYFTGTNYPRSGPRRRGRA